MPDISVSEWIAAWEAAAVSKADRPEGAVTARELADAWDMDIGQARKRIYRMFHAGLIKCVGRAKSVRADGVPCHAPLYVLDRPTVKKQSGKGRRRG